MSAEIRVPRLAESISEAVLAEWLKPDGAAVRTDEPIATLETDKAAVEIAAESDGVLHHVKQAQERVVVGDVIGRIDANGAARPTVEQARPSAAPEPGPAPAKSSAAPPKPGAAPPAAAPPRSEPAPPPPAAAPPAMGPAVRRLVEEHGLDAAEIPATGAGGRLLKEDVSRWLESRSGAAPAAAAPPATPEPATPPPAPGAAGAASGGGDELARLVPMSLLRRTIAERLVQAQHTAAILTTFNEVDMSAVLELRARHKESFEKRHGVKLGFMSFFARASILALEEIPELNAFIRGQDIAYPRHVHLGIAVGTERGLVVPVVRRAETLDFAGIEREIARLAERARANRLSLDELMAGTFTISNGGVYGSLLSTPILNPPQSGILGMHKIEKRPVALDDQVVIRPMMYLALSYDHRIVDGEQAVTFLVRVKERLEDPERMLLGV